MKIKEKLKDLTNDIKIFFDYQLTEGEMELARHNETIRLRIGFLTLEDRYATYVQTSEGFIKKIRSLGDYGSEELNQAYATTVNKHFNNDGKFIGEEY